MEALKLECLNLEVLYATFDNRNWKIKVVSGALIMVAIHSYISENWLYNSFKNQSIEGAVQYLQDIHASGYYRPLFNSLGYWVSDLAVLLSYIGCQFKWKLNFSVSGCPAMTVTICS